ncbi:long-chain-fatty-acid--CoA ligase [Nocardia bovistercoris]|uniref:AMP-binding protein n=1 Tax=Nocardia bovistercoris TaxID=2785916 RepID=A0A931IFQ4_9NOCA|nr:long-chain-fatty-acid--CoA ligase [Nocardia bovistercoris]MBH0780476.1 AMP-binding protein [Nocardia bovistercoris]
MSAVTRLLFDRPASDSTGLWSGADASELTFRTWRRSRETARALAGGLADADVGKGDSVAILAGEPAEVAALVQAVWLRGAAFTMLHQPTPRTDLETWVHDTRAVIEMLDAGIVAVGAPFTDAVRGVDLGTPVVSVEELAASSNETVPAATEEDDIAILQLTSGTTGTPKAVAITYRNLWHNQQAMLSAVAFEPEDVVVSWLPLYHDMGMIGMLIAPMLAGITTVNVTPLAFLKNPVSWAELVTRFGATVTAAPDFAYSILTRRLRRAPESAYDLSSLRVAIDGAEALDAATLHEFAEAAARFGFHPEALMPAYGMAETTLAVSFTAVDDRYSTDAFDTDLAERDGIIVREPAARTRTLVKLGRTVPGIEATVVDENGDPLPADRIGTIMVRGDAVTRHYLGPTGYVLALDAAGRLDTGDLGYLTATGEIVVTGRKKDVIIVSGRNISPVAVERAAATVAGVRPGAVAAIGVRLPGATRESIAVIAESDASGNADTCERIRKEVARAIYDDIGVTPAVVTVVDKGALPKTPSGKLRRSSAADLIPTP